MKQDIPLARARRSMAGDILKSCDDQVLTSPGFGSTVIEDNALQAHICQTWHLGLTWELWKMVSHVIAGAHDLYYEAGAKLDDPLIQDLEFLRELAHIHHGMASAERIVRDAKRAAG